MKKKYLSWLFTLAIMVVGLCLLPAKAQTANNETLASAAADATLGADNETTLAPPTAVDISFTADNQTTFSMSLKDGEVSYVVANENKLVSKWEETDAPSDNYVRLEYDIESATL